MKHTIRLPSESQKILRKMADEAGVSISDLIEISVYNLIACWIRDKNQTDYIKPFDSDDVLVDAVQPDTGLVHPRVSVK